MGFAVLACGGVVIRSMFPPNDVKRFPCDEHTDAAAELEDDDGPV